MSAVKINEIKFNYRYVSVELFGQFNNYKEVVGNLESLYEYIDKKEGGNSFYKYGKAYRKILKMARAYAGARGYIISKRQVSNLIKVYDKAGVVYVKIPYAADYIFRAIFTIFEQYRTEEDIPENIVQLLGKFRRECFYKEQCFSYARLDIGDDEHMKYNLNLDLNTENGVLGRRF